jgi:hypothetical protein
MEASLHQELRAGFADQLDGLGRGRVAVRSVHDLEAAESDSRGTRDLADLVGGAHQERHDEPLLRGLDGPPRALASQGWATAVGMGSKLRHLSRSRSYFPVPGF